MLFVDNKSLADVRNNSCCIDKISPLLRNLMKTKMVIRSAFDSPPEEAINEFLQTLDDGWKVVQANTTHQFYNPIGEPNTTRPHFVTTLVLERQETQSATGNHNVLVPDERVASKLASRSINELPLRSSLLSALFKAKIETLEQLSQQTVEQLRKYPGIGFQGLRDIDRALSFLGFKLKT